VFFAVESTPEDWHKYDLINEVRVIACRKNGMTSYKQEHALLAKQTLVCHPSRLAEY